jgi:hypothetical protein
MSSNARIGRGDRTGVVGGVLITLALAPGVLGALALGISGYATWENAAFNQRSVEARGRVVEIVRRPTGRTDSARYRDLPVVEFTTTEGDLTSFTSDFGGNPKFAVGDEVRVLYPPERPSKARLAAAWATWGSRVRNWAVLGGVVAVALSMAMTFAGWTVVRRAPKMRLSRGSRPCDEQPSVPPSFSR